MPLCLCQKIVFLTYNEPGCQLSFFFPFLYSKAYCTMLSYAEGLGVNGMPHSIRFLLLRRHIPLYGGIHQEILPTYTSDIGFVISPIEPKFSLVEPRGVQVLQHSHSLYHTKFIHLCRWLHGKPLCAGYNFPLPEVSASGEKRDENTDAAERSLSQLIVLSWCVVCSFK